MAIDIVTRTKEGQKTPTRAMSKLQETKVAKKTGGRLTPNSGATDFGGKGDVVIDNLFLIECKTKMEPSKSMSIKKEWFDKNKQEAVFTGKPHSALVFNFGPNEENHYVIDEYLFLKLVEALKNDCK